MNKFKTALRLFAAIAAAIGLVTAVQASQVPKTLALADFNGNGDDEAVAVVDNMGNGLGVVVDTGTLGLAGASFLFTGPGAVIDAAVLKGQAAAGRDGVAFLLQQDRPVLEAYDPQTGKIFRRVRLPAGHEGVSLDTRGNLACVLTTQTAQNNRPRLFTIDVTTKAVLSKPALSKNLTGLNAVFGTVFFSDTCHVLLSRNSDGKGSVQPWNVSTGMKSDLAANSAPIPKGQDPIDHAAAATFAPSVATLALRQADARGRIISNDRSDGTTNWAYALPAGQEPVRMIFYSLFPAPFDLLAVLANRNSDNTPVVTILDAETGALVNTIEYNAGNVGNDVSFHEPTSADPGSSDPELAVTTNMGVVEIRDSVTGNLIGSLGGG